MLKQQIIDQLQTFLQDTDVAIQLEIPQDRSHGDYTTNVAFHVSKILKKSPMEVAEEIAKGFALKMHDLGIEKVEAVKPGFINFTLSKKELGKNLAILLNNSENFFDDIQTTNPQFEIYENIGPNTNKPLHIGHVRNGTLGGAIVNLRKAIGHKAWSGNINNDRGIHIVKCMWSYLQFGTNKISSIQEAKAFVVPESLASWRDLLQSWFSNNTAWYTPKQIQKKPDHLLGIFYLLGDRCEKEKPESLEQMREMLLAWEDGETHVRLLWELMNNWFYEGFRQTHARLLGVEPSEQLYDKEWYESELYKAGKQLVLDNLDKGLFYKRDDNVILASLEKYGLPDKVVIRSDGSSLYITFDLEEAREMAQDYKADLIAHVVSNEQELYFKQLFSIIDALQIAPKEKFLHIAYGTVYLKGGAKMSSREGTVILADDLMDMITAKIKESFPDISDETADRVGVGALKYTMLKFNHKADINFDVEESISVQGNSGPYLQYTFARTQSILAKYQMSNLKTQSIDSLVSIKSHFEVEEISLLREIYLFSNIVEKAALTYSPNMLCEYLFTLGQLFNLFYQKHRIIDAVEESDREFRVAITIGVGEVLKRGLSLLGIAAPEKM